ncbi:unnamed protein product [Adineta ricciae]|uniref:Uncharacterized protein n=3 Tax=Adineta ricciae TaxID=249248 RepID=A0A815QZH0_ADIRI|nr:unnamed protein product [Adineta ricciae]
MLTQTLCIAFLLSIVEGGIHIYHTEDGSIVEFYDCIPHEDLLYCRRPSEPIVLQRDNNTQYCYNDGKIHPATSLLDNSNNNYICECTNLQSFGRHCEYLLPMGTTFEATLRWELEARRKNENDMQIYGDILCYKTLTCDSGLLCLDWRDICDGVQQCMFGYDEENCDKLEFNECENDEYRCMNGMCIPDEYFLDGDYDCMDMTDEIGYNSGFDCAFQKVRMECDDRVCLRFQYSCGDGQCIDDRLAFRKSSSMGETCRSCRDQYYMCETHSLDFQWTLPNGRCYIGNDYNESSVLDRNNTEQCIYFLKCALSDGAEVNCDSMSSDTGYIEQIRSYCQLSFVQYPAGAILSPYTYYVYSIEQWSLEDDDIIDYLIILNATIKCREYLVHYYTNISDSIGESLHSWEAFICTTQAANSLVLGDGYDQFCYTNSRTFTNQSYNIIDVCNYTKECISAYRIADGLADCVDRLDEAESNRDLVLNICSRMQRYRFRCSSEQSSCLSILVLNNYIPDCNNNHDEILPVKLYYNSTYNSDRKILREYIEHSWKVDKVSQLVENLPFRAHCNTFWDLELQMDEDRHICKEWWICSKDQWQCHSGQCIDISWILDGEWDCLDASDEQGIFFTNHSLSAHNIDLISNSTLRANFLARYNEQSFWNICDFNIEFPCFPVSSSHLLTNTGHIHPCIGLEKVGDGHPDCLGGMDERNTMEHCNQRNMLGYAFQCLSTKTCVDFYDVCVTRCPNVTDDQQMCVGSEESNRCNQGNAFQCWNGTCIAEGWCNDIPDCAHGEDEYYCQIPNVERVHIESIYRIQKKNIASTTPKLLNLPAFPDKTKIKSNRIIINSTVPENIESIKTDNNGSSPIAYICNRGVGMYTHNGSIVCFCPEQYYGDKCQLYSDQLTLILSLNISNYNYTIDTNIATILKMLVVFTHDNETVAMEEFHVRPAIELTHSKKQIVRFLYSRTNASLKRKRQRYFNRSNIIHEHPYSVQIEAYELNHDQTPLFIGIWKYPIYFDYLPSFRLVKILRLTTVDHTDNPCSSNPCKNDSQCHQLLNQPHNYICFSVSPNPNQSYCFSQALYRSNYYNSADRNDSSTYCICPLKRYGRRCELSHDECNRNPCENNGTCLSSIKPMDYYCSCAHLYYGKRCELLRQIVSLHINGTVEYRAMVIQYFRIDLATLNLILISQHVYQQLPEQLTVFHNELKPPDIIVAKQYLGDNQVNIYIIALQTHVTSANIFTDLRETNRCVNIRTLFSLHDDQIHAYKYHNLCRQNHSLFCFFDDHYLCICDADHYRVECFGYNHNLERCSSCFANSQCLIENRLYQDKYICLCPQCRSGRLCQFMDDGFSFTLHSALLRVHYTYRIIYCLITFLIFIFGGLTNYATLITFNQPNVRNTTVGIYLLFYSIISQLTLLSLTLKSLQILVDFLMNDILCKIISYMLSITMRCSFWMISWVAIVRVGFILFPFSSSLKNVQLTIIISFLTLITIAIMNIHELYFYLKDPGTQSACIVSYSSLVSTYERTTIVIHYIIPFSIQTLSVTTLIILAARSRSRATNHFDTFFKYLQWQFRNQKEMYVVPLVIIVSGLPQSILSFSFSCMDLSEWQKHLLLIAYLLAHTPQSLGFILFVLPSTNYLKEFQRTNLSKMFIFRLIISKVKRRNFRLGTTLK